MEVHTVGQRVATEYRISDPVRISSLSRLAVSYSSCLLLITPPAVWPSCFVVAIP